MDSYSDLPNNPLEDFSFSDPFQSWWPFVLAIIVGVVTTIRAYLAGPSCPSEELLHGKTVVITGGSSGVGLEVVVELLRRGAKVIVGTRNEEAAASRIQTIMVKKKLALTPDLTILPLELSSLESVREFVQQLGLERLDVLINNAGIAFHPFERTREGLERHFVTNYLAHFLLTQLLLPRLQAAESARIINVSAQAHYLGEIDFEDLNLERNFNHNKAYAQSKLAFVFMTRFMANLLQGTNVTINAMHPGLVRGTNHFQLCSQRLSRTMRVMATPWAWLFMKSPEQGAQTIIYMAVEPSLKTTSGKYFSNCSEIEPSEKTLNEEVSERLYNISMEMVGLASPAQPMQK